MRIDMHGHCGALGARSSDPAHTRRYLEACAIERLLVANLDAASEPEGARDVEEAAANVACLEACRDDSRLAPVYWVRFGKTDSNLHALAGALEIEPFVAVLLAPALNGYAADDAGLDAFVAVAGKLRRPVLVLTSRDASARPALVYALARRHRSVPVVLCGAGGETVWHEAVEVVARARDQDDARLVLCTGRAEAGDIVAAVETLGGERVVLGSDVPALGDQHAAHGMQVLDALAEALPAEVFADLVGGNAQRMLPLL